MQDVQTEPVARGVASVATPNAARYVTQLCKHFQHKGVMALEGDADSLIFADVGVCRLRAAEGILFITVEAMDEARRDRLKEVIERHLQRFAFREALDFSWSCSKSP